MTRMTDVPVKRGSIGMHISEYPTFRAIYGCVHVGKSATRRNAGADHYPLQVGNNPKIGLQQLEQQIKHFSPFSVIMVYLYAGHSPQSSQL
jgi:hypothetical protein